MQFLRNMFTTVVYMYIEIQTRIQINAQIFLVMSPNELVIQQADITLFNPSQLLTLTINNIVGIFCT